MFHDDGLGQAMANAAGEEGRRKALKLERRVEQLEQALAAIGLRLDRIEFRPPYTEGEER